MAEDEGRSSDRRRYRSRSRSESDGRNRRRSHLPSDDKGRRLEGKVERRKRHRSRSRERPRKRRSISPEDGPELLSNRERSALRQRDQVDYDSRKSRQRRSSSTSRSPRRKRESPVSFKRSKAPLPSQQDAFKDGDSMVAKADPGPEKQKPNFSHTGRLAAAANTVQASGGQSIVLKYHEPSEARKPPAKEPWRMYVFKGDEILDTVQLAAQSCWLFGREAAVADYTVEHPSCSKQHAVIQFRYMEKRNEFGDKTGRVRPYVIDLESANGTMVNEERLPEGRYVELRDKDVVKFGHSSREYVMQLPPVL